MAMQSRRHEHVRELRELPKQLLAGLSTSLFPTTVKGKKFNPRSLWRWALVRKGCKRRRGSRSLVSLVRSAEMSLLLSPSMPPMELVGAIPKVTNGSIGTSNTRTKIYCSVL
jgi:hypothetical protein